MARIRRLLMATAVALGLVAGATDPTTWKIIGNHCPPVE